MKARGGRLNFTFAVGHVSLAMWFRGLYPQFIFTVKAGAAAGSGELGES